MGYFYPNKHFLLLILTFKSSFLQLFWTFNLSFDILATVLATFPNIGLVFSIFWSLWLGGTPVTLASPLVMSFLPN
jgi:hypothetical protein